MSLNVGKSIGRVSIRALPDTKNFRRDLLQKLKQIEKTTSIGVNVDRARVDRRRIRESIERQLEGLDKINVDANVRVNVDKARLRKAKLRKSIQEQFDQFDDIRVNISAHIQNKEQFERDVKHMVDKASRLTARINVNAVTPAASAQMAWLARDRFAQIIPRVSKAAAVKVATTLAALSGGRVAFKWLDNLADALERLDKTLPKIGLITTGLGSLTSLLFGAVAGIVGLGDGLVAMLPFLLAVPGLILNAGASLTVLIRAMFDAKEQLAELSDEMTELGEIMSDGFWKGARQPILDLVNGLMPQLRTAFGEVSRGLGSFTGAFADSLGKELADGRLESIFDNIAEGWDILATGTDGFAGAIVNLSQIAARYTPRLATWFVRQADTFDAWLTAISTDGRLDKWMNDAVDAAYDLWDATRGTAGVLTGIWKAAEKAGAGGLKGFAESMLAWDEAVNSPRFQKGLTALFRGSLDALDELGEGFKSIGDLIHDQRSTFEYFLRSSGEIFGGLISDVANALNSSEVSSGVRNFMDGLASGADSLGKALPKLSGGVEAVLTFAGGLAEQIGPVIGSALEAASGVLDPFLTYLNDEVLPVLGPALTGAIDELAPELADLGEKLGPIIDKLSDLAVRVLPSVVDALESAFDLIDPILDGMGRGQSEDRDPQAPAGEQMFAALGELTTFALNFPGLLPLFDMIDEAINRPADALERLQGILDGDWGVMWAELAQALFDFGGSLAVAGENIRQWGDDFKEQWANFWAGNGWVTDEEMSNIEGSIRGGMGGGMSAMTGFTTEGTSIWSGAMNSLNSMTGGAFGRIVSAIRNGVGSAVSTIRSLPGRAVSALGDLGGRLWSSGASLLEGFIGGIRSKIGDIQSAVGDAMAAARGFFPFSPAKVGPFSGRGWTAYSGAALMDGFADGIRSNADAPKVALDRSLTAAPLIPGGLRAIAARVATPTAARDGGTVNLTVHNPLGEPTERTIHSAHDLILAALDV